MSCSKTILDTNSYYSKNRESLDYADLRNWAAHPMKRDNSDSVSLHYENQINEDLVDIFFLYPTSFTDKKMSHISNASIEDSEINYKTDNTSILYQASVFNQVGRIYAPRYRQAHISRYYETGESQVKSFDFAYQDVAESFNYYLNNFNEGRTIIIAAHSQGTTHAIRLIKESIDNHRIQQQIVFYYLLGMPVKKEEFKNIFPCASSKDFDCYYSWRTYRKGYNGKYVNKQNKIIQVNNPVDLDNYRSWTSYDSKKESILWKYDQAFKGILKTKVQGDMLWITRPRFKGGLLGLFMKNYHAGDINLFYGDIRDYLHEKLKTTQQGRAH